MELNMVDPTIKGAGNCNRPSNRKIFTNQESPAGESACEGRIYYCFEGGREQLKKVAN